jgi:Fe-S cluster biogenesis protein NfuA
MGCVDKKLPEQQLQFQFNGIRSANPMREKVEKALNDVRPALQADGGDVELVDVENNIVKVKLKGACAGCPMSQMTLKQGIERYIKKMVPEIIRVESV